MSITIEDAPEVTVVRQRPMSRHKTEKTATKHVRLSVDFATKLSVIANAMTQTHRQEVSSAEAADISLGEALEREFIKALEQLGKLRKDKVKPSKS